MRDRRILYATAFLRALATGATSVLLGVYLARLDLSSRAAGLVVGAGLGGAAAAMLAVTWARGLNVRRALVVLSVLAGAGGIAVSVAAAPVLLALAAFAGMVNGMGRDRGAALALEQAMLPATAGEAERTRAFAWYNVLQDAGHALGALLAGWLPLAAGGDLAGVRCSLAAAALLLFAPAVLYRGLSAGIEPPRRDAARVSPRTRRILWKLSALFAVDSLAGGFLTTALLTYFFTRRFGVGEETVGLLFFGARVLNALSHLAAWRLARRIGLLNTMVFTHIPSSLFLAASVFAPSFPVAAALFLLREGLVEMDVPTRQSYVMALVRPEERVAASAVTNLVRMAGWAVPPLFAGVLMEGTSLAAPFLVGAGMKIAYDLVLYAAFRGTRPAEEGPAPRQV
jgi:MFS family permease